MKFRVIAFFSYINFLTPFFLLCQVMWLFREAGAPYLFLHALWNPAIRWRNGEFRLRWGGKAEAVLTRLIPPAAAAADTTASSPPSPLLGSKTDYCIGGGGGDRSSPPPSYGEAMGGRHHLLPLAVKSVI
jgi:hypothetical protein